MQALCTWALSKLAAAFSTAHLCLVPYTIDRPRGFKRKLSRWTSLLGSVLLLLLLGLPVQTLLVKVGKRLTLGNIHVSDIILARSARLSIRCFAVCTGIFVLSGDAGQHLLALSLTFAFSVFNASILNVPVVHGLGQSIRQIEKIFRHADRAQELVLRRRFLDIIVEVVKEELLPHMYHCRHG